MRRVRSSPSSRCTTIDEVVAVFFEAIAFADFGGVFFNGEDFDEAVFDLRAVEDVFFAVVDFCAKGVKS